jgi:hypothetical protein
VGFEYEDLLTPFCKAAKNGHGEVAREFLNHGVSVHLPNDLIVHISTDLLKMKT